MSQARIIITLAALLWALPQVASAATYKVCGDWLVDTIDSGVNEDYYSTANNGNVVVSRYAQMKVTHPSSGWSSGEKVADSVGCITVSGAPSSGSFRVYAWYMLTDPNGTRVRMHGGSATNFGSWPGGTYYWYINTGLSSSQNNYVLFGNYSARSTLMGMLSVAHLNNRSWMGLNNKTIHVADDCFAASAHYCNSSGSTCSWSQLSSGRAYINIPSDSSASGCPSDWRRRKFLAAHELGHAEMLLYTQRVEPNSSTTFPVPTSDTNCHFTPEEGPPNGGYTMTSEEWSIIGAREGFGHLFATTGFNNTNSNRAWMNWLGQPIDVEYNSPGLAGGYHVNNCDNWYFGAATNVDWLRTYWDYVTPTGSSGASLSHLRDLYLVAMLNHPNGYNLLKDRYWGGFVEANEILGSSYQQDRWETMGCWNGSDKQPGYATTGCY